MTPTEVGERGLKKDNPDTTHHFWCPQPLALPTACRGPNWALSRDRRKVWTDHPQLPSGSEVPAGKGMLCLTHSAWVTPRCWSFGPAHGLAQRCVKAPGTPPPTAHRPSSGLSQNCCVQRRGGSGFRPTAPVHPHGAMGVLLELPDAEPGMLVRSPCTRPSQFQGTSCS